jgi:Na+-transporting methylmalonyl-CoA/oxaloacetate decarboxylase gamma subunit
MSDFGIGLQVTALGMGLVFLTLVIVMLVIMALDRLFRPRAHAAEEAAVAPVTGAARPIEAAPAPAGATTASEVDALDEATAIGVAIAAAVADRSIARSAPTRTRSANPLFRMPDGEEDIPGEVVLVATVDGGSGVWARAGRFQAMN